MQKQYTAKVYSLAGTYLATFNPKQIASEIRFSSKLSGGQGECILDLNLPIDDFGEGTTIAQMNIVRIYECDDTFNTSPVLVYTGFISKYSPFFSGTTEGVRVTLLGLVSLLSFAYYRTNGGTAADYTISGSGDPAAIMRLIIDNFTLRYPSLVSYGANCIDVGTSISYQYVDQKHYDALKKTFELSGGGRYWTIREDGTLHFKLKPATATHTFTIGKDLEAGEMPKSNEKVLNYLHLRYGTGPIVSNYQDAMSIAAYGSREKVDANSNINDGTTANSYGNGSIADGKDVKLEARLRVNSNYNIESIHPGDTCKVLNIKRGSTVFGANMLITSVSYDANGVSLDLDNDQPSFADVFNTAISK
jgi:hypothetical protein